MSKNHVDVKDFAITREFVRVGFLLDAGPGTGPFLVTHEIT